MSDFIVIKNRIKNFNRKIEVSGDKSISIRWVLLSSLADGISISKNLLMSEDVMAAINAIKKLGIKVKFKKNYCKIYGQGIDGYKYKKNIIIDAQNSGTLGRLILGLLVNTPYPIKLIGDKSLSRRDFKRVTEPLSKFGAKFSLKKKKFLPLTLFGSQNLKPIYYNENRGSAQCKSSVIFAGMRTNGETTIKAKKSRNHTELLSKYLKLPINTKLKNTFDIIKINKVKKINKLNYNIPSDISSCAFFIVLTTLATKSKLIIRNVNINSSRIGVITILNKMGANIKFKNIKKYKGEKIADIIVKSPKELRCINCPEYLNSAAIDEFLIIFLVAAKAKGISYFKNLNELNQKESPRLKWGEKILKKIGIKTVSTSNTIKIYGNPNLKINKKIIIKKYLKDHRVFMTSMIAALSFGGNWEIHDKSSIKTSFPQFINIINKFKKDV
tara:strand:- start:2295 stop:3620 length:1326 start_codon:yes stop_codon:yes gene_type:complete